MPSIANAAKHVTRPTRTTSDTRTWRRGTAPVPAGQSTGADGLPDYGYFGPDSIAWKVFLHPFVAPMIVTVTALLEANHEGMQAVEINHDPVFTQGAHRQYSVDDTVKRIQRTAGVPIPIIFGDTASADALAVHLRKYHRNMKGLIPGTDRPYDAQGPALVLFAHVTIMHAALRIYENTPAPGRLIPQRLPAAERDRFFSEVKAFAELMGADADTIPVSAAEVAAYYESIESEYGTVTGMAPAGIKTVLSLVRNARDFGGFSAAVLSAVTVATAVPSVAVVPPKVRRHLGIPRVADPLLVFLLRASHPVFAPLSVPLIAREISRLYLGDDNTALGEYARRATAQPA